jgi:hypothetical protein
VKSSACAAPSRAPFPWEVQVDLFFYRDPEEATKTETKAITTAAPERVEGIQWGEQAAEEDNNWEQ